MTHHQTVEVTLDSKDALYQAYMSFISGGGLFIQTTDSYQLGDKLKLKLLLPEQTEQKIVNTTVIWLTDNPSQGVFKQGIGVQFLDKAGEAVRKEIEVLLGGSLNSDRPTDTI